MKNETKKLVILLVAVIVVAGSIIAFTFGGENEHDQVSTSAYTVSTMVETTQEIRLSAGCDKVLADGYDAQNNFYELVANQIEDYSGIRVEMGILKNNQWLVKLSNGFPFEYQHSIYDQTKADFYYVGNGCFVYGSSTLYNCNTNTFYRTNEDEFLKVLSFQKSVNNNDGKVLIRSNDWDNDVMNIYVLDTNTMQKEYVMKLGVRNGFSTRTFYIYPLSDDLFAIIEQVPRNSEINGFYNLSGEKVIDLSQFDLYDAYSWFRSSDAGYKPSLMFENGKCSFDTVNPSGTLFTITVNTKGDVINQVAK